MCGIIGFLGFMDGFDISLKGLRMLLNRGYDSCGCAGVSKNGDELIMRKYATTKTENGIDLLARYADEFKGCENIIFHSRWSTHGPKTDVNAHPHVDHKGRIALCHNGIIENYYELKQELESKYGVVFRSQTDTEVIVNLISVCYDKCNHMEEAISEAISRMHGTWALVIMSLDKPDNLYCARQGSPLLLGFGSNFMIVASEQSGFAGCVNNYVCLNDHDIVVLRRRGNKVLFEKTDFYEMKTVTVQYHDTVPDPFPHWTIREIHEQYEASIRAINFGGRLLDDDKVKLGGLDEHRSELLDSDHLLLIGCGTSFHAGWRGAFFFKELTDFDTVQALDAGEFNEKDIPKRGKSIMIVLTQSGESKDVHRAMEVAKAYNIFMIGVVNVVDSLIAREVNCGCYLNAGREVGVASTKAFTSQIIVLSMMAIWFAQNRGVNELRRKEYIKDLRQLPQDIKRTIQTTEGHCERVALMLQDKHSCFVLGKGSMEPFAKEGALKIKEIGYIHAEGYSAVALKHGPFSLLQEDTPVIILNPNDETAARVDSTVEEVRSRHAPVIKITDKKHNLHYDQLIVVPNNKTYKGILHTIPMQIIGYYLSISRGINPDMPRNLAKCVTVF